MLHSHTTPPAFLSLTHLYPSTPTVDHTKPLAFGFSPSPHHFPSPPTSSARGTRGGVLAQPRALLRPGSVPHRAVRPTRGRQIHSCGVRGGQPHRAAGGGHGGSQRAPQGGQVGGGAGRQLGHNTSAGIRTGAPGESGRHGAAGGVPAAAPRNRLVLSSGRGRGTLPIRVAGPHGRPACPCSHTHGRRRG
ncbi:unnamed protein product [Closterium sp. NIES-54]